LYADWAEISSDASLRIDLDNKFDESKAAILEDIHESTAIVLGQIDSNHNEFFIDKKGSNAYYSFSASGDQWFFLLNLISNKFFS